jgi:hypothetical protein
MIIEWLVRKKFFRNENHALWFFLSMGFYLLALSYYFLPHSKAILVLLAGVHLVSLVITIYTIYILKQKTNLFSRDCVWFNSLMLILYIIMWVLV